MEDDVSSLGTASYTLDLLNGGDELGLGGENEANNITIVAKDHEDHDDGTQCLVVQELPAMTVGNFTCHEDFISDLTPMEFEEIVAKFILVDVSKSLTIRTTAEKSRIIVRT